MKRLVAGFVLLFLGAAAHAQTSDGQLAKINDAVKAKISREMPDWTYRSIEPVQGSKDVIIQHWELGDIAVKIAIAQWDTEANAAQALADLKNHLRLQEKAAKANQDRKLQLIKEDLPGVGDEGYAVDIRGSEGVAFRKGVFLVNISVPRPDGNKDVFFSRQFANHILKALRDK